MWWGRFSNRNGRVHWRSGFGSWESNSQPIDEQEDTRIEPNMPEAEIDSRLRRRVMLRRKMYREFFGHLVSFTGVNALIWGIWLFSWLGDGVDTNIGDIGFPWPLFVTLFWGFGLVMHGIQVYQNSAITSARREQAIQRDVELERARLGLERVEYEKPKRGSLETDSNAVPEKAKRQADESNADNNWVRLSDDGELISVEDNHQDIASTDQRHQSEQGL